MIEVYRGHDSAMVGHLQSLLEAEGIGTYLRNEFLSSNTVVMDAVSLALCVLDEADAERGVKIIRDYLDAAPESSGEEQICPNCGESTPSTFAECWQCGEELGGD